jgi:hypothetical protein
VTAHGQDGAFAVGKAGGKPAVQRYQGGQWSQENAQAGSGAMRALAVSGSTVVAAGLVVDQGLDVDAGIWRRTGGGSWLLTCGDQVCGDSAPGAGRGRQQVLDLVAMSGRAFVAVGRETSEGSNRPAVWRSQGGTNWTRVAGEDLSGAGEFITGVAARGNTLVAVGSSGRDGAAWISDDGGSTWTKVIDDDLAARGRSVEPQAVSPAPSGFVAVGRERLERGSKTGPVAWFSADGRSWSRASIQKAEFSGQQMTAVTSTADGLVAAGADRRRNRAAIWESADGEEWSPVSSSSFSGGKLPAMTSIDRLADGTVLAVGYAGGDGRAWTSEPS